MGEKIRLMWHTYTTHGQELFRNLLETQQFTDVTLISDDQKQYRVHKFILSACSTVFREIITSNPLNTAIYLRGIYHEELESILQFIYLGEATFYDERMNEFLNVAQDLDIKDIGKNVVDDDEKSQSLKENQSFDNDNVIKSDETESKDAAISSGLSGQNINIDYSDFVKHGDKKSFQCQQCHYQASRKDHLKSHVQVKHEGIKYPCKQCDFKAVTKSHLQQHMKSKHEGIVYPCHQCNHQATAPSRLQQHIKSIHLGFKYLCQQCDFKATKNHHLQEHIKSKHEGIKFQCNLCNYQANFSSLLSRHVKAKH